MEERFLDVRSSTRPIRDEVFPPPAAVRASQLVILIHGYQNSSTKAKRTYGRFENVLGVVSWERGRGRLGEVWGFLWPGDHDNVLISLATYSDRIQPAMDSGQRLAWFLNGLDARVSVRLIAHSLGCRVALEAIREIQRMDKDGNYKGAEIEDVFLLAAAVPVRLCLDSSDSFPWPREGCGEHVYWSHRDRALDWKFRVGQYVFKKSERGPAVGRTGDPDSRWTSRFETNLGHSDYWASAFVARAIVEQVSFGRQAFTPSRYLPEDRPESELWKLDETEPDEQSPPVRRIAA